MEHSILKSIIVIFSLILFRTTSSSQSPNWLWADATQGPYYDQASCITSDNSGFVYLAGHFVDCNIPFGSVYLTAVGANTFIAKYSPGGTVIWAKQIGGSGLDIANTITTDPSGNVYVAGTFLGPFLIAEQDTVYNSNNNMDFFIVKYDSNGNLIWLKSWGGSNDDQIYSITTDGMGNLYAAGGFDSPSISIGTYTFNASSNIDDALIVKYDPNGNVLWARSPSNTSYEAAKGIICDSNGNVFVAGVFSGVSLTFGANTVFQVGTQDETFIAKYDNSGNNIWARAAGGNGSDYPTSICTDTSGNAYIVGAYTGAAVTFGNTTLTGGPKLFIVKYDGSGNVIWANKNSIGQNAVATSIAYDKAGTGSIFICGNFKSDTLMFTGSSVVMTNNGINNSPDFFIAKFDSACNMLGARSAGTANPDHAWGICTDIGGYPYIAGDYDGTLTLGPSYLWGGGQADILIAKMETGTAASLNEIIDSDMIQLYPNPSKGLFSIKTVSASGILRISDLTGKYLHSCVLENEKTLSLDLSDYNDGVFLAEFISESGSRIVKKLVLIR